MTVRIKSNDFYKSVCRELCAVSSNNVLSGVQSEADIGDLTVHAEAEQFVLLQRFVKTDFDFLPLVIQAV